MSNMYFCLESTIPKAQPYYTRHIFFVHNYRVSNVYSDDRYNRMCLHCTYKLPEVGGAFGRYYGHVAFQVPSLVFLSGARAFQR